MRPVVATAVLFGAALLASGSADAQQPTSLFNAPPANPAASSPPDQTTPSPQPLPRPVPDQPAPSAGRVFCEQNVTAQPAKPAAVPERYRPFVGIFSDADWNPQTCAALIVEAVGEDGTATITYVFGPITSGGKGAGGVLHGTGIIKDEALLFQNTDGSQYAFEPFYSDLAGKWTTPKGQTYEAVFKRAF
jgi:hypothetical protein